ncbi:MAG TPA: penicillin-binding transpeptidase domain-containing protein [Verrucomicrobiaceae bacterium]|jgi:penicillin-binding protein 2
MASAEGVRRAEPADGISIPTAIPVEPAAQALPPLPKPEIPQAAVAPPPPKAELKAGWQTQTEARTFTLSVPAPRGQITDRHGVCLAQCRVVHYLALNFPYFGENAPDSKILEYAAKKVSEANRTLRKTWNLTQDRVLQHYKNRRWLPLVFSVTDGINDEITPEQQKRLKPLLDASNGLMLQPAYLRIYPKGAFAAHLIGYTHKTRPLPVGPIQDGDVLFEEQEGADGLEKSFDRDLQGRPGLVNVLFNPDGTKVKEEVLRRALPGNNVVTTIDCDFQRYAEEALAKHTTGGAMVILNVRTGEIMAMASYPLFDPNLFVPSPTAHVYQQLLKDKTTPLYPRAFQGEYPPASTFKVIVALAGLESGAITQRTAFDCTTGLQVGDRVFHNWNKEGEGELNVVGAIKRSCNTWFYQAGLATGGGPITNMAVRMGFGERTGVPLVERPGFVPTDSWMQQHRGHKNLGGDIANLSIGQGLTLVTPLQAAQCMAALADGTNMPQARLVMQVQDLNDHVVQAFAPSVRRRVDLKPIAREPVVKGMIAVVNGQAGTGQAAALDDKYHCQLAGKTGTAQWKPNEERRLAWFTGFLPANDPLYAYAVVYEGQPGEEISGGKKAAPIVHEVFTNILKGGSLDEPLVILTQNKDAPKAVAVSEEDEQSDAGSRGGGERGPERMRGEMPYVPPPSQIEEHRGVAGFFQRLFGH